MYIVDVIPITRGIGKEQLSYFTTTTFPVGNVVTVPLRKKKVPALIIKRRNAKESKAELRSSDFTTRKVASRTSQPLFVSAFVETARECANFCVGSTGAVLDALTPQAVISDTSSRPATHTKEKKDASLVPEIFVVQGDTDERFSHYKSQVREEFARGSSVLFLLPTRQAMENVSDMFKKGIERYIYTLHGSMKKDAIRTAWDAIASEEHPVLIIATSSFMSIPRTDIKTIIVENESNTAYKQQKRPFIDTRIAAEIYARHLGARIVYGDTLLRTETIWRERTGEARALSSLKFRMLTSATQNLIDMRTATNETPVPKKNSEAVFKILGEQVRELITDAHAAGERTFLFGARRGLASTTVCHDCGTPVICEHCGAPVVLHSHERSNVFVCHKCSATRSAAEYCRMCESWNLVPLGIGVERIYEAVQALLPDEYIFSIDSTNTSTSKQAQKAMDEFVATPGGVLIGTSMALPHLPEGSGDITEKIEHSAIVSLDSLFAVPDFRMNETILRILTLMRLRIQHTLLIQTRMPDQPVFSYAIKGNMLEFYRTEVEEREAFSYPPFVRFVKLTLSGPKQRVEKRMTELGEYLADFNPHIFPAYTAGAKGKYGMNALLKIPRNEWPHHELIGLLRALPQEYVINVEPISIL